MRHPQVKFRINQKKEVEASTAFLKEASYSDGRNLDWAFYTKHPELKGHLLDVCFLKAFVQDKYKKPADLRKQLAVHEARWKTVSKTFFALVDDLFESRPWPKGRYVAFGTIWGMYPRFLEERTFLVPFKHKKPTYVSVIIAHELLHFLFYDLFYELHPEYRRKEHNFFSWNVSEIFNDVVQNSPAWLHVFREKTLGYPEHETIVKKISKQFAAKKYGNATTLMEAIIAEVKGAGLQMS